MISERLSALLRENAFTDLPAEAQLAVALSPATRIEPELIRAVRLTTLPRLDVAVESDLWFSDWVGSRSTGSVVLRAELLAPLRAVLVGHLAEHEDDPLHQVWSVLAAAHDDCLTPALRLEERVTELALTGGDWQPALRGVLRSLVEERRAGIADWTYGAWLRLPDEVLNSSIAWLIGQAAKEFADQDHLPRTVPADLRAADVRLIADVVGTRHLRVTAEDGKLGVGGEPADGDASIEVVNTDPAVVDIVHPDGEETTILIPADRTVWSPAGGAQLSAGIRPPVEFVERGVATLPSVLLCWADRFPPRDQEADLDSLTDWLTSADPVALRLLYGGTGERQLANALAAVARRTGWTVRREDFKSPPGNRTLVIIETALRMTPDELAHLVTAGGTPLRVLALDQTASAWWEAATHRLAEAGCHAVSQQRLGSVAAPVAAFRTAAAEFAGLLGLPRPDRRPQAPIPRSIEGIHSAALTFVLTRGQGQDADDLPDLEAEAWQAHSRLGPLMIVATLLHPLDRAEATTLLSTLNIGTSELLDQYERWYPTSRHGVVAPMRPRHLAAVMLRKLLAGENCLGVPGAKARSLFDRLRGMDSKYARRAIYAAATLAPAQELFDLLAAEHSGLLIDAPNAVLAEFATHATAGALTTLWNRLSRGWNNDLGIAMVAERIIGTGRSDDVHGRRELARRYTAAGLADRAVRATTELVKTMRLRAAAHPESYQALYTEVLGDHSRNLLQVGKQQEAVAAAHEAVRLAQDLGQSKLTVHRRNLATALLQYGQWLAVHGSERVAVETTAEAVDIHRMLAGLGGSRYDAELASALQAHGGVLSTSGLRDQAIDTLREAVTLLEDLTTQMPAIYHDQLGAAATALSNAERANR
ncbi:hypothetical protein ACFWNN_42535 [Lentzea sp. NPDC058450]|uniref:hypothetical protein n=1 Tax=Lentzea sp. NPDC058450 TaxID=3346505 RepID=UPI00365B31E4